MKAVKADSLLNQHGFVAPKTLVAGWRQHYGIKKDFFTVATALEGYENTYQQVNAVANLGTKAKREFLLALATDIASLHKANISHGDMRAGNILSKKNGLWKFGYIDNEKTKKHWRLPARARIKNLVQLNLLVNPAINRSDRLYFFQAYCEHCYGSFNKKLLEAVLKKTRKRMARLLSRNRIQPSDVWL